MQLVQAVTRAFSLLERVARTPETPQPLSEIALAAGLNAATCARLLNTLVQAGYVEQVERRGGYVLGPMAYALSARGPYRKDLVHLAEPHVVALAAAVRESAVLAALHQGRRVILCEADGDRSVQVRTDLAQEFDPYRTVTGRLLLAHLTEDELDAFLARQGLPEPDAWSGVATESDVRRELDRMRLEGRGLRQTEGEIAAAAVPIREHGRVTAAVGVHLPTFRFTGDHKQTVITRLEDTRQQIEASLAKAAGG